MVKAIDGNCLIYGKKNLVCVANFLGKRVVLLVKILLCSTVKIIFISIVI